MRKIVDCSGLESSELTSFLSAGRGNQVLLTDVCQKEAFAAGSKVRQLLKPFDDHPGQAILLMPTWHIWRLRQKTSGFFPKFIDKEQTAAFPKYCRYLVSGNEAILANVVEKQQEARAFLDKLLVDAGPMLMQMADLLASYSSSDLAGLRSGRRITATLCDRIVKDVAVDASHRLREAQGGKVSPRPEQIKASLILRFSVCYCALGIRRASVGGLQRQAVGTFRNDLNDCMYASYATLFDGLITADQGMAKTYNLALFLLRELFECRAITAEPIPE